MTDLKFVNKGEVIKYSVASEWSELTEKQIRYIAKQLPTYRKLYFALQDAIEKKNGKQADKINGEIQRHRIFLFTNLAGINLLKALMPKTRAFLALENDELAELLEITNFIFREVGPFANFFPVLEINGVKHYCTTDDLSTLEAGEFSFAESEFVKYKQTGKRVHLRQLLAILYRPEVENYNPESKDFKGDRREVFNRFVIEPRAKRFKTISYNDQQLIALWWEGAINGLRNKNPRVFTKATKKGGDNFGWLGVFRQLGGNALGIEKVAKMNLNLMLLELGRSIEEAEKNKKD